MKPLLNVVLAEGLAAFAAASAFATDRYWSASNGARAPFNRTESWSPKPESMSDVGGDRLVLDKGLDNVAEFAAGDAVRAENLYLGYDSAGSGCLEMTGGTLTLSNFLVGHGSGFDGKATVSGNDTMLNASVAIYVGDKGNGELTINGGTVHGQFAVQFGGDNVSGNTAVVNLNGGVLSTEQVNAHGSPIATFNWNGGVLRHSGGNVIFPENGNITINVLEGGAFFESSGDDTFNHPFSGEGAFTCRVNSGKTLTLAGAVDLKGGFKIESGNLKLTNLVRTKFREISVAQGCTLDLNGASVTVASYSLNGVAQPEGKYSAHNGTIRVDREAMAEYSRPEVLWTAAAWYDPSDADALTKDANGKVTGIQNRGTVGSDLDLVRRNTGKSGAVVSEGGFNGRSSLYFDNASGYVSSGYFPTDLPASGPRTLFVVAQGDVSSMVMLSVAQKASGNEEGRSLLLAHGTDSTWGSAYQIGRVKDGETGWSSGKVPFGTLSANKPYVFAGRTELGEGDGRIVKSFTLDSDGNSTGTTKDYYKMPAGQQGLRFVSYYGAFEIGSSGIDRDTIGYQGEALIFTNALTDAEMDEVNAYLKAKWLDPFSVEPDDPEPDDGSTDSPATRYWADSNEAEASFNARESWDPKPRTLDGLLLDTLILDKGIDKVAVICDGDTASAKQLYVGYRARGGCLDVSGGTFAAEKLLIGNGAGSTGKVTVSGENTSLNLSIATYVGDGGDGELTINGGSFKSVFAVQFGTDGASGNTAVLNLNGGTLETGQINAHGTTVATFNWNGGTLRRGASISGGIFPANDSITVNVLEGGAFFESGGDDTFNHPLSGEGAFTCRVNSGRTLTLAGAVDLKGGFRVERGNLKLSNLARTRFREISVAQGCTLDLNGASVTVASYSIDGVAQPEGKYSAHNGTIRVDREAMAEYSRPEVLWTAAAWYDPSDADALTKDANGKVTGIKNRGTAGSDLDLVRRNTGKSGAVVSEGGFNGRSSLYFDNASGYVSSGYFPADLPASGPRTLFVVAQGDVSSMVMLMVSLKSNAEEEGRSLLLAHGTDGMWGSAYQVGRLNSGEQKWSSGKVPFGTLSANEPYVFAGRTELGEGDGRIVKSFTLDSDGNSTGTTKDYYKMPAGQQGLRFVSYYGAFEIGVLNIDRDTTGYQGEALIFTNALTDAEMDEVNAYLKAKWLDSSSVEPDDPEPDDGSTDSPATRYWADSNEAEASFGARESWDPKPKTIEGLALDKLVLNKGVDKVATIGPDDDVNVKTLYVGWGTLDDGANMSAKYDKGGRLDVTGGLLTVTDYFRLGGGYSDHSNNVVNVTGGRVVASRLRTSDCSRDGGKKCETLNVSGTGVFEIAADEALLATYSGGETFVNVTDGGTFTGDQHIDIGRAGKATFTLDGGTVSLSDGKDVNIGRNWNAGSGDGTLAIKSGSWTSGSVYVGLGSRGAATGELVISGGTVNMKRVKVGVNQGTGTFRLSNAVVNTTADSGIGIDADSTGTMVIESGKFVSAGDQFRIGEKGTGVLIMDGGELTANIALELNGNSNNVAKGTMLMLNGGKITVGQINTKTSLTTATMMWDGGVLSCNGNADSWGGIFPKSDYIKVNVLGGGAIYETAAGRESKSETIAQPLSGSGAFTKRGGGTLNLTGALDLKGGFNVEGGTLEIGGGTLARTTFSELSVGEGCTLKLNGATVMVAAYKLNGVAQPEGTYNAHGGTVIVDYDAMSSTSQADRLVVDGELNLGGEIVAVDSVSGSGFATNGTVVVTGDIVVSVSYSWAVDVPTFDRLVLGPNSRLVVMGAGYLPRDKSINILPFTSLSGRFGSVVGEGGVPVNVMYEEDHVCARRGPGTCVSLR